MAGDVDVLAAPTLKHLRERWWDDAFTAFVRDTVQPRAGRRILDVGCGTGTAEVRLSRLHLTQVSLVAVDLSPDRVARGAWRGAVAQHPGELRRRGRLRAAVSGRDVRFGVLRRGAAAHPGCRSGRPRARAGHAPGRPRGRGGARQRRTILLQFARQRHAGVRGLGPLLQQPRARTQRHDRWRRRPAAADAVCAGAASSCSTCSCSPSRARSSAARQAVLGRPAVRHQQRPRACARAPDEAARRRIPAALDRYAADAGAAGQSFVEIQNTMLFATVGQRLE